MFLWHLNILSVQGTSIEATLAFMAYPWHATFIIDCCESPGKRDRDPLCVLLEPHQAHCKKNVCCKGDITVVDDTLGTVPGSELSLRIPCLPSLQVWTQKSPNKLGHCHLLCLVCLPGNLAYSNPTAVLFSLLWTTIPSAQFYTVSPILSLLACRKL